MTSCPRVVLAALLLATALALPGCLSSSQLQCTTGTVQCGDTCVATATDSKNCGACGAACSGGNVCVAGACTCPSGQAICGGECKTLANDPKNCGGCGVQCGADQVCNQGVCQDCSAGGCRNVVVLAGCKALSGGGYLLPIEDAPGGLVVGTQANPPVATFPDALGLLGSALLYADHDSSSLLEIPLDGLGTASSERLTLVGSTTGSKAGTTQLAVEATADGGSRIYAVTSSVNAIRIFGGPAAETAGDRLDAGSGAVGALGLTVLGGVAFDPFSFPEPFGKIGDEVFVPLNGTGQVLRVNVSDPAHATVVDTYDLGPVVASLPGGGKLPDGGAFDSSPTYAVARNGYVYVAANVLRYDPARFVSDYGPPLVVRIDPSKAGQAALSAVQGLSADGGTPCQNVTWLASLPASGGLASMLVSCGGNRSYDDQFNVTAVANTALVLLDGMDRPVTGWTPSNGAGQVPPSVGRALPDNGSVYVADESLARLYVLSYGTNSLTERVGYLDGGTPPQICPSYISDLQVLPPQ